MRQLQPGRRILAGRHFSGLVVVTPTSLRLRIGPCRTQMLGSRMQAVSGLEIRPMRLALHHLGLPAPGAACSSRCLRRSAHDDRCHRSAHLSLSQNFTRRMVSTRTMTVPAFWTQLVHASLQQWADRQPCRQDASLALPTPARLTGHSRTHGSPRSLGLRPRCSARRAVRVRRQRRAREARAAVWCCCTPRRCAASTRPGVPRR
mmetsp:Transcript_15125/g.44163  ORF Transcript_15125/g.44163 Transcript_15125/m.44163 type:complete len:204 (+) Transcript_15125:264-875(+)